MVHSLLPVYIYLMYLLAVSRVYLKRQYSGFLKIYFVVSIGVSLNTCGKQAVWCSLVFFVFFCCLLWWVQVHMQEKSWARERWWWWPRQWLHVSRWSQYTNHCQRISHGFLCMWLTVEGIAVNNDVFFPRLWSFRVSWPFRGLSSAYSVQYKYLVYVFSVSWSVSYPSSILWMCGKWWCWFLLYLVMSFKDLPHTFTVIMIRKIY